MNLPNRLTVLRMLSIPLITVIYLFPYEALGIVVPTWQVGSVILSLEKMIVLVLFILASITDYIDGSYARKHNMITTFGKFMDPIADKLLVNTLFFLLALDGLIPAFAFIIMIWRDTIVDGVRMLAADKGQVIPAANIGKLKTVAQMLAIMLVLIGNLPFEFIHFPLDTIMVWVATLLSAVSGVSYVVNAKDLIFESK